MTLNRQLFDVALQPTQGSRFAPTGFPDLGAAVFDRPTDDGWEQCILVESAQSMANRLEGTLWDGVTNAPHPVIALLPYVDVVSISGNHLTSSREESHRLASPYVRNATIADVAVREITVERLGLAENTPLDYPAMASALLTLDPLALVHGVFFAGKGGKDYPGQPKFARLITGFIEATDVRSAESGGVKRDHVSHTQKESGSDATEGYGSVPFARTEWTARTITASFNIDLAQLRSYGLPDAARDLLLAVAQLEIRHLLDGSLRLRTNCDFEMIDHEVADRNGDVLPPTADLETRVAELAVECANSGLLGGGVLEATWAKSK